MERDGNMNKKELIERIENLPCFEGPIACTVTVNREWILNSIEQLDQPQKVQVPQFVADWYEGNKNNLDYNILNYVCGWEDQEEDGFKNWFNHSNKAFQTLVNMHQFGYTVEKEKRYRVKAKNIYNHSSMLKLDSITGRWFFGSEKYMCGSLEKHTRKELEDAGFGEVFNSPMFEVEEVEE